MNSLSITVEGTREVSIYVSCGDKLEINACLDAFCGALVAAGVIIDDIYAEMYDYLGLDLADTKRQAYLDGVCEKYAIDNDTANTVVAVA